MKKHTKSSIRRSVALPAELVERVSGLIGPARAKNWNRLVISALEEYAERHRRTKFEQDMAAMAADPAIRSEIKEIAGKFRKTEHDGL
jgi:metal-responsive CopG/Arc/MetJ family transcriptional regulator